MQAVTPLPMTRMWGEDVSHLVRVVGEVEKPLPRSRYDRVACGIAIQEVGFNLGLG